MKVARDYRDFLQDILAACRSTIRFAGGMTLEAYLGDEKTRYAVMRGSEIMGEAVRHVPDAIKSANPDIPWTTMTAVRNRIVHGYFGIDDTILFTTIDAELKPLRPASKHWCTSTIRRPQIRHRVQAPPVSISQFNVVRKIQMTPKLCPPKRRRRERTPDTN